MNNKDQCTIRLLIYKTNKGFRGIVFELGIVEEMDDQELLYYSLMEASQAYIEAVRKNKLPDKLLNKKMSAKYEKKWDEAVRHKIRQVIFQMLTKSMIERMQPTHH